MFGRKNTPPKGDEASRQLQKSGVYSMGHGTHPFIVEDRTVEAVKTKKIYSFWSGVWYTAVLSVLLFWVPPFGQMIAGYVGGRKAGSPFKGLLAALLPMCLIFILFMLRFANVFVDPINRFLGLPGEGADYVSSNLPVLGPVFGFMSEYIYAFGSNLWSYEFFIYPYVLTVIFGYVGGILSLQHRKEMEAEGKTHPFSPVTIVNAAPQPYSSQDNPDPSQDEAPKKEGPTAMTVGKPSKNWKMKNDRHKGKW